MENLWDKICAEHSEVDIDDYSDQPKRMQRKETQIDYKKCSAGKSIFFLLLLTVFISHLLR